MSLDILWKVSLVASCLGLFHKWSPKVSFFLGLVALDATTVLLFDAFSTLDLLFMLANDDGGVFTSRLSLKS